MEPRRRLHASLLILPSMLLLAGCVSAPVQATAANDAPTMAATETAVAEPVEETTAPEPDQAQKVQAAIDSVGGWDHWSDTVTGLEDNGVMVTIATSLYDKASNEEDARKLCNFAMATVMGDVPDGLAFRVAASDGVSLAKCQLPD